MKIVEHGRSSASRENLDGIPLPCKMLSPAPNQRKPFFGLLSIAHRSFSGRRRAVPRCSRKLPIGIGISMGRREHADPPTRRGFFRKK